MDESRLKAEKVRQFSEHVKHNFSPQVDETKREAIEQLIEAETTKKHRQQERKEEEHEQAEHIRLKGLRYLE